MNLLKKYFALLSAAVVCLGLSACSVNNDDFEEDPDIVGNDWRVTGVVCGGGSELKVPLCRRIGGIIW